MESTEQEFDAPATGAEREAPKSARARRGALATGAVALLAAATLAACGGDDSSSETTSASTGAETTQSAPAETTASGEDNGVADLSADEVLAAARDAALGATAVHVSGEGEGLGLDLTLVRGEGAEGSIDQGGTQLELVAVGGNAYLKGTDDFWRETVGEDAVDLLGGKWLRVDGNDEDFASFTQFTDFDTFLGQMLTPEGRRVTKGEVETRDGQEVVPLTGEASRGTLYIAATGEPFPVAIVPEGADEGEVTFDGWNEPVELTAPEDAVDAAELESTAGGS